MHTPFHTHNPTLTYTLTTPFLRSIPLDTRNINIAATSDLMHLMAGQQQASPRLWRHFHAIHVNAAASAAGAFLF